MADNSSGSSDGDKQREERARVSETSQVLWHARQNNVDALEKMLKQNPCLVNARDYDDRSALHVASFHGCTEAAKCLLDHGASVNAVDRWENSALADAENARHVDTVELLKSYGGLSLGNHGSHFEAEAVAPPYPHKCDWEINPTELDFTDSSLIGKGSFGEIRIVNWRGTPVAVKSVLPSLSNDKLVIQDFRHEVDLLVKLRHPNIVQFLGAVTRQPPLMLITEYLSGGDLHQFLEEKGPLSTSTAVNFALDIARGMTYLHNEPCVVIHRDLKPRNILLVNENHLKVGDFGLSKLISAKFSRDVYKMTGETGSYRYMAPEVFKHRRYDAKVDVFSFAMILYEMFEGSSPFSTKKKRQQCKEQQQNVIQIVTASKAKKEAQKRSVTETMTSSQAKKEGVTRKKKGKKPAEEVGQGTCKITRKEGQEEQEEDVRMSREFYSQFCEERDAGFMELKNVIQKTFNDTVSEVITALGLRQQ